MTADDWAKHEMRGNTEVTLFHLNAGPALTGADGTRLFKKEIVRREDARAVVEDALMRMPAVRARWPWWPRPAHIRRDESEIVVLALLLAAGRPDHVVDRLAQTQRRR